MKITIARLLLTAAAVLVAARCTTTDLTVNAHAEEDTLSCGPAALETIMDSYPTGSYPADPTPCTDSSQTFIGGRIAALQGEGGWNAEPAGMRNALTEICPPTGGGWSKFARDTREELTFSIAYWMKKRRFPAAVLLSTEAHNAFAAHQEHWVTVTRIDTLEDPETSSTVTLLSVTIVDQFPSVSVVPHIRNLSGAEWAAELKAVTKPGLSTGKFIAVIEPPPSSGRAVASPLPVSGTLISAERAARAALQFARGARRKPEKFLRTLAKLRPQRPLLIDPDHGGYYLIPFARSGQAPSMAILVNAYNGAYMEAAQFDPQSFLSEDAARASAQRFLGRPVASTVQGTLVAPPSRGSRYQPLWRFVVDGQPVTVDLKGNVTRDASRQR